MTFRVYDVNGDEVHEGDQITSRRGEPYTLVKATRPRLPGKTGKVVVKDQNGYQMEYYDTVFNLEVE